MSVTLPLEGWTGAALQISETQSVTRLSSSGAKLCLQILDMPW